MGLGEYVCDAYRQGAGFNAIDDGGLASIIFPCHYIQLGECGCAPDDVVLFGLDPPNKPCYNETDCKYLCNEAGEKARNLCHAFGGVGWFEGDNFLGYDAFLTVREDGRETGEVEIYIKGVDL